MSSQKKKSAPILPEPLSKTTNIMSRKKRDNKPRNQGTSSLILSSLIQFSVPNAVPGYRLRPLSSDASEVLQKNSKEFRGLQSRTIYCLNLTFSPCQLICCALHNWVLLSCLLYRIRPLIFGRLTLKEQIRVNWNVQRCVWHVRQAFLLHIKNFIIEW